MRHDVLMKSDFKAFYKSPWGMAFIGYFIAMGLVGALTPPDILTDYSWTSPFTDFMASIVPQIDKVTALGIDSDINRFYFSVMWAGSPLIAIWVSSMVWLTRKPYLSDETTAWRMPFNKFLLRLLGAFLFSIFVFYFFQFATENRSRVFLGMFGTRIGRGFISQLFVISPVIFFSIGTMGLLGWFTGFIPRNIRKQNELEKSNG